MSLPKLRKREQRALTDKMDSIWTQLLVVIISCTSAVAVSTCGPVDEVRLLDCANYTKGDVYCHFNQSNFIATALVDSISAANGSYCREKVMEFLCNYYFPPCKSDTGLVVPICTHSCVEHNTTGICAIHLHNVLMSLMTHYPSIPSVVDVQCSPPYGVPVSGEDCVTLSAIPSSTDHVQCVPVPPDDNLCRTKYKFNNYYAPDVAIIHTSLVTDIEFLSTSLKNASPFCAELMEWFACTYQFPPCSDNKLLSLCPDDCVLSQKYTGSCFEPVVDLLSNYSHGESFDNLLQNVAFLTAYSCVNRDNYYMNFKTPYFQQTNICYDSIPMTMAPAPMTSNNSSEIMLLIGLLVGAVVLVIVLTLIVVGVCVVWRRRVMNKRLVLVLNRLEQNPGYTDSTFITEYQQFNHKIQLFTNTTSYRDRVASFLGGNPDPLFAEFEEQLAGHAIKANMLQINEQIAEGAFGKVYKGVYTRDGEEVDVAIKTLRDVTFNKAKEFIRECITAIQFSHPNVLGIIGVSVLREEGMPLMVLPYMCHGDVKSFLKSKRKIQMEPTEYPEGLSYDVLIKICSDVSKGMEYLSSLHFVHRDLAARNCMLDSSMVTKVADFGFSRDVHSTDYYRLGHPAPLPIKWLAPEALNERLFTTKSDVWSFGITCWEVFTLGSQPYPSVDHNEMASYLHNGGSLDKPHLSTDEMYGIMRHCWNYKAEDRPTFSLLVEEIDHLLYDDSDDQLITEHKTSFTNTAM